MGKTELKQNIERIIELNKDLEKDNAQLIDVLEKISDPHVASAFFLLTDIVHKYNLIQNLILFNLGTELEEKR